MSTSEKDWDGTEELQSELKKLDITSGIAYTGGGCWVLNVELNNGWQISTSRSDGPECGFYYGIEHNGRFENIQGMWGPEVGPAQAALMIRDLIRCLGTLFEPN
ncbi:MULTISPECIES: hypothetical protein [Streptomyces]|uniref:Uncharacterized protein n=2 Tax=Streptomyces TaxID=1883 RepID=A0ABV9IX23_9ACTN